MKKQNRKIWIGTDQLNNNPELAQAAKSEFVELPVVGSSTGKHETRLESSRRDFLKYLGFGIGAATMAACDIPVRKAIPYVVKPDSIVPGVATYYASTFVKGGEYCPVLVKTREGRPINLSGNTLSNMTTGGTSARAQASVLSLYDTSRYDAPRAVIDGKDSESLSWEALDTAITNKLGVKSNIRIVANTILSPLTRKAITDFKQAYPETEVVMYDPISSSALLQANEESFGHRVIPEYHFDKADVIVGIDCDFLGTWISPVEYARQYTKNRLVDPKHPKMSRHIQIEGYMSVTGSSADNRIPVKPSELGAVITTLYNEIAAIVGEPTYNTAELSADKKRKLAFIAKELLESRSKSLVVSGTNNKSEQILINAINNMLGNYGHTISFDRPLLTRQGIDKDATRLVKDMQAGNVDAIIVMDSANPAYNLPGATAFREAMAKVNLKISLSGVPNETALLCDFIAPTHHYLESWGDAEPKTDSYSMIQPAIAPIFASVGRPGTRHAEESLLRWAKSTNLLAEAEQPMLEYLKSHWEATVFPKQNRYMTFQNFW
ncbi:MAG: TAT-variant-translocated molybdopterin oxidoreductase, partial [Bacteroidota bacterium]